MEFAFALPESASVAWGTDGVWLERDDAWPPEHPFVLAHPEMFSLTPSKARRLDGSQIPQVPMSETRSMAPTASGGDEDVSQFGTPRRGRRANG